MNEDKFKEALHLILLGLNDLKTLHVELANAVVKRCERIKTSGKLENPGKDEVRALARIDQLRCVIKSRCKDAAAIQGVAEKDRKHLNVVMETMGKLKDINLTFDNPS
jgi:hypothetical protein